MIDIKPSIARGWGTGGLYDILVQLNQGMLPISGQTYYVSKYGSNQDGLTWKRAFTTITAAIAASNTYIAVTEHQYARNRIYIDGGGLWSETLATLPNQCDVIGVGARTGWKPTLYGRQNITTAVLGCHIYNIMFYNPTTSVPAVTILAGSHGIEFHKCNFTNGDGNDSSVGLQITDSNDFIIDDCCFPGNPPSVIGISLLGTSCINSRITNNFINATTTGIAIANGMTGDYGLLIKDNVIFRADPNSDSAMAVGIDFRDTSGRTHACVINNRIAAADGIQFDGTVSSDRDHWMCIGNLVAEGATATAEAPAS